MMQKLFRDVKVFLWSVTKSNFSACSFGFNLPFFIEITRGIGWIKFRIGRYYSWGFYFEIPWEIYEQYAKAHSLDLDEFLQLPF